MCKKFPVLKFIRDIQFFIINNKLEKIDSKWYNKIIIEL